MTKLIVSKNFNDVNCDFYQDDDNNNEIMMTREQIGTALFYSNPRIAIQKIHERNKNRLDQFSVVTKLGTTDGKAYNTYLYTIKGIYEICRYSKKPKANAFMDWVWNVVESVRKHGAYMTPETIEKVLYNPDFLIKLATNLKTEQQKNIKLLKENEVMQPKVKKYNQFLGIKNAQTMNEVAKILDIGRNTLFKILRESKILQYDNAPYQIYMTKGYFKLRSVNRRGYDGERVSQTLVTPQGMTYIYNLLLKKEVV